MERTKERYYWNTLEIFLLSLLAISGTILLFVKSGFSENEYTIYVPLFCFVICHPIYLAINCFLPVKNKPKELEGTMKIALFVGAVLMLGISIFLRLLCNNHKAFGLMGDKLHPFTVLFAGVPTFLLQALLRAKRISVAKTSEPWQKVMAIIVFLVLVACITAGTIFCYNGKSAFGFLFLVIPLSLIADLSTGTE